jgi:hypothetical protein
MTVAKALKIEKDIFDMQQKMKETELALKKQGIAIKGQINQQPIVSRRRLLKQVGRRVRRQDLPAVLRGEDR